MLEKTLPTFDSISLAKSVIETEIRGLVDLEESIGRDFEELISILENCTGRVIITGMGKSGHIANKFASTLASTGTKSFFIHPAEASHGDLGMISEDDVVIALSNSGETPELRDLIVYCKRFAIKIIAMTRCKDSTLADQADLAIIVPNTNEANSVNAPTTSTTMMLALGDAIAVTLLERKGFNNDHFKVFHPGGKLGSQLKMAADYMHIGEKLPIANVISSIDEIVKVISVKSFGCAVIIDSNDKIEGIITDGDIRRHINDIKEQTALSLMTKKPITIHPTTLIAEAVNIMNSKKITSLLVANDSNQLLGILHIHDCLRAGTI